MILKSHQRFEVFKVIAALAVGEINLEQSVGGNKLDDRFLTSQRIPVFISPFFIHILTRALGPDESLMRHQT